MEQELDSRILKLERGLEQNSELIAELYKESGNLTVRSSNVEERIKALSNSLKNMPKSDKDRPSLEKIERQTGEIEAFKGEMEKLRKRTKLLYKAFDAVTKHQNKHLLEERIKNLAKETESQVLLSRAEIDGMAKSLERSMKDVKNLGNESLNGVRERLEKLERHISNQNGSELKNEVAALRSKISSLESSVSSSVKSGMLKVAEEMKAKERGLFKWERDIQISKKELEQIKDSIERMRFEFYDREKKIRSEFRSSLDKQKPMPVKVNGDLLKREKEMENSLQKLSDEMRMFSKKDDMKELSNMTRIKVEQMENRLSELSNNASKIDAVSKEEVEILREELAMRVEVKMKELEDTLVRMENSLAAFASNGYSYQKNIDVLKSDIIELFQNKHNESNKLIASHIEKLQNRLNELEKKNSS